MYKIDGKSMKLSVCSVFAWNNFMWEPFCRLIVVPNTQQTLPVRICIPGRRHDTDFNNAKKRERERKREAQTKFTAQTTFPLFMLNPCGDVNIFTPRKSNLQNAIFQSLMWSQFYIKGRDILLISFDFLSRALACSRNGQMRYFAIISLHWVWMIFSSHFFAVKTHCF